MICVMKLLIPGEMHCSLSLDDLLLWDSLIHAMPVALAMAKGQTGSIYLLMSKGVLVKKLFRTFWNAVFPQIFLVHDWLNPHPQMQNVWVWR